MRRERQGSRKNFRNKKGVFDAGEVWLEALRDFENELHEHVEQAKKDQLRFQDGRLTGP